MKLHHLLPPLALCTLAHATPPEIFSNLPSWQTAIGPTTAFPFSPTNLTLANEVSTQPVNDADIGPTLTFPASATPLPFGLTFNTLESEASFIFGDAGIDPVWRTNALSIGKIHQFENDDFSISLSEPVNAIAFHLINNERAVKEEYLRLYRGDHFVAEIVNSDIPDGETAVFIGIKTSEPFDRIVFNEDAIDDDVAISGFSFPTQTSNTPAPDPKLILDPSAWSGAQTPDCFTFTATNLTLSNEVSTPPGNNANIGNTLTFPATATGMPVDFTLNALESGADITYNDNEGNDPVWRDNALSIGDIGNFGDDDFSVTFSQPIQGFAFDFINIDFPEGDTISLYDGPTLIAVINAIPTHVTKQFVGILSDQAFDRIEFDKTSSPTDNIAIANFKFILSTSPPPIKKTFTSGNLGTAPWVTTQISGAASGQTFTTPATDGNPDTYFRAQTNVHSRVQYLHLNPTFVHDPSSGSIDSLTFSIDIRNEHSFLLGMGFQLALQQNGSVFVAPNGLSYISDSNPESFSWHTKEFSNITASSFQRVTGSSTLDLSSSGSPITFGFTTLIDQGSGIITGFDNYWLTLCIPQTESTVSPGAAQSWSQNTGWINWNQNGAGAKFGLSFLSGFIWCQNTGWINLGDGSPDNGHFYANLPDNASDFGINRNDNGTLDGYAWSANLGWINFTSFSAAGNLPAADVPKLDLTTGQMSGYAWSQNAGWINLGTNFSSTNPVTIASIQLADTDNDSIDDSWELAQSGSLTALSENTDSDGDGISDYQEFLANSDPNDPNSRMTLDITYDPITDEVELCLHAFPGRSLSFQANPDLTPLDWSTIASKLTVQDPGDAIILTDDCSTNPRCFFRAGASIPLLTP